MSTALQQARERIDDIDRRFVELLAQRQSIVDEVSEAKAASGREVRDEDREEQLLDRVRDLAEDRDLPPDLVSRLYEQILAYFVQRQRQSRNGSKSQASDPESEVSSPRSSHRMRLLDMNGQGDGAAPDAAAPDAAAPDAAASDLDARSTPGEDAPSADAADADSGETPTAGTDRPYRLAARARRPEGTVVHVGNGVAVGDGDPVLIAGPCSVESREQILESAEAVARSGGHLLRGGCFKPRTSPYSFQGLGEDGLDLLAEAGGTFGLPVITEVMAPEDVPLVAEKADVLQIGARNMQNTPLLKALGGVDTPVMLKRGMVAEIDEWLAAADYILSSGNPNVFLCERGIRTFTAATRNTLDISAVPVLRERTHLPVIVDPAHACGERRWVPALVRAALAAGADGVMIEAHPQPDEALSDGPQSLPLDDLPPLAQLF